VSFERSLELAAAASSPPANVDDTATHHAISVLLIQSGDIDAGVEHLMLGVRAGLRTRSLDHGMSDGLWMEVQRALGAWKVARDTLTAQVAALVLDASDSSSRVVLPCKRPAVLVSALADLGHALIEQ